MTSTKKIKDQNPKANSAIRFEIAILVSFAVCVLLLLSNFGLIGAVGNFTSNFMFGMWGFVAYIIPILLFLLLFRIFIIQRRKIKDKPKAKEKTKEIAKEKSKQGKIIKIILGVVIYICIAILLELITNPFQEELGILEYYIRSAEYHNGGGLFGGLFVSHFASLLGVVGTYIITIFLLLICIIILSGKPILSLAGNKSKRTYDEAKAKRQTANRIKEEERAKAELERKAKGVLKPSESLITDGVEGIDALEKPIVKPIVKPVPSRSGMVELKVEDYSAPYQEEVEDVQPSFLPKDSAPMGGEGLEQENVEKSFTQPVSRKAKAKPGIYIFPPMNLLTRGQRSSGNNESQLRATALKLEQTLANFGVMVHVTNASRGPSVTRYELQPEQGVKVSKIVGLSDDIKLNLAVSDLRIEAPIPGKAAVGIEVPNQENTPVMLRELLESNEFQESSSKLSFAVGKDISGKVMVTDIAQMPHLLIAGSTGSGKSVCINTLILSIIYKANPDDVKLIMIDPKVVELSVYNGIPHMLYPVVTDPKKAAGALNWAVSEMTRRYQLFAEHNVRNLEGYNNKISLSQLESEKATNMDAQVEIQVDDGESPALLPQIVIIVDELADLMMVAQSEVEAAIVRLSQLARAAGLHLVVATQRPSVNVITGLIKANMPSRIAFAVTSGVDSRTIIDMNGAEKLLGKGDMLFYPGGYPKPVRVQGSFVSDKEVRKIVDYLKANHRETVNENAEYVQNEIVGEIDDHINGNVNIAYPGSVPISDNNDDGRDAYFVEAGHLIIEKEKASIGMLQRMFKIGFNRAARIMDQLHEVGLVSGEEGTKARKILMSKEDFEAFCQDL